MASILNADNGVVSGSAGLKSNADSSGVLELQTNGTTAVTVNTNQSVSLTAGTANGVTYLNGSKVLTSGSALTFDGTNLSNTRSVATAFSGTNSATWANGIALTNSATPATGVASLINFGGASNVNSVFGVAQSSSGFGDFVWAGYSGSFSEQMRLTSTGLGIGTSSPSYKLEVYNSSVTAAFVPNTTSTWSVAQVRNNGYITAGNAVGIAFVGRTDVQPAGIAAIQSTTSGGNVGLSFMYVTSNATTEGMRLDSAGNLGLGVTPSAWSFKALQIGGSYGFLNFSSTGGGGAVVTNAYFDGTNYKYQNTNYAGLFDFGLSTAGAFSWRLAASGTAGNTATFSTAMTLDASGNLGVGTTSPAAKFQTQQTSAGSRVTGALLQNVGSSASTAVSLDFAPHESSASPEVLARINAIRTQTSNALTDLVFSTFNATLQERARITSGGSLCVGRTTNIFGTGAGLCVEASSNTVNAVVTSSSQSALSAINTAVNTGTSCSLMSFNVGISGGGSQVGTVTYNGTIVQYNSTSDQRLKKNIVDAGSGLAKLANVKIRAFDWIEHDNHTDFGVVAQELVTVAPEAVSAGDTGETIERTWAVDTSTLVPAMIKAIQEQQALIQQLQADVAILKGVQQ